MKKIITSVIASIALSLAPAAFAAEPADTVTVFMIGDSTMANKPTDSDKQERGWGQLLATHLQGPVKVDNHARNGQSSLSFINEGKWDAVVEIIRPGDFVIIQFGHNDEKLNKPSRGTTPGGTFDANLRRFVEETRAKGGRPILMNAIVRRNFPLSVEPGKEAGPAGPEKKASAMDSIQEGDILVDTHGLWRDAPRNVAQLMRVPFVDMNTVTHKYIQELGPIESRKIYMWIPAGKFEFCPDGKIDNTHLNIYGATVISRLAADAIAAEVPDFAQYVRPCCKEGGKGGCCK